MSTAHESAQSLMRLYELRREEKLREARTWVTRSFNPRSAEEFAAVIPTGGYTYWRMMSSYWDMAASFVVHGAIEPEMFRSVSGEMLVVYSKVNHMIDDVRERVGQPTLLQHVEQVAADWQGADERMARMREYFSGLAAADE